MTDKAVSIEVMGTVMSGVVIKAGNQFKLFDGLWYYGVINAQEHGMVRNKIRDDADGFPDSDIHKGRIVRFCIGAGIIKSIEGFFCYF